MLGLSKKDKDVNVILKRLRFDAAAGLYLARSGADDVDIEMPENRYMAVIKVVRDSLPVTLVPPPQVSLEKQYNNLQRDMRTVAEDVEDADIHLHNVDTLLSEV